MIFWFALKYCKNKLFNFENKEIFFFKLNNSNI